MLYLWCCEPYRGDVPSSTAEDPRAAKSPGVFLQMSMLRRSRQHIPPAVPLGRGQAHRTRTVKDAGVRWVVHVDCWCQDALSDRENGLIRANPALIPSTMARSS